MAWYTLHAHAPTVRKFWHMLILWAVKDWVQGDWSDAHKMDYGSHMDQVMKLKFDLHNLETLWYQKI